jgi:hypothetical protein
VNSEATGVELDVNYKGTCKFVYPSIQMIRDIHFVVDLLLIYIYNSKYFL